MREIIIRTLDAMKNIEEKAILKNVLNDIFLELFDESEKKYAMLEQRVRNELPLVYAPYTVYCTVLPRNRVDDSQMYLSSMIPHENEPLFFDTNKLIQAVKSDLHPIIGTVFYEADNLECRRLDRDRRIYTGYLDIGSDRYPIRCRLTQTKRYTGLVEELYNIFLRNNVPWTTMNCAYINKFFDVHLIDMPNPPPNTTIGSDQISISFASHEDSMRWGFIPVWNIDKHRVKGEDLPVPALDKINYEYRFNLKKLGEENGFLVDYNNTNILNARREEASVIVVSPRKRLAWDLYRFRQQQDASADTYPYPVLSNARKDAFSTRMTAAYGTQVNTRAELYKLTCSFTASDFVVPESASVLDEKHSGETYNMNPFIYDELRNADDQKTLLLSFRAKDRDFFLNRDLMSFLVSQIQFAYRDYNCVGVLL